MGGSLAPRQFPWPAAVGGSPSANALVGNAPAGYAPDAPTPDPHFQSLQSKFPVGIAPMNPNKTKFYGGI